MDNRLGSLSELVIRVGVARREIPTLVAVPAAVHLALGIPTALGSGIGPGCRPHP